MLEASIATMNSHINHYGGLGKTLLATIILGFLSWLFNFRYKKTKQNLRKSFASTSKFTNCMYGS